MTDEEIVRRGISDWCVTAEGDQISDAFERLATKFTAAQQRIAELELEEWGSHRLRESMADKLTRTANVVKGEPPPLTLHSWHDLPERTEERLAELERQLEEVRRDFKVEHLGNQAGQKRIAELEGKCLVCNGDAGFVSSGDGFEEWDDCEACLGTGRRDTAIAQLKKRIAELEGQLEEVRRDFRVEHMGNQVGQKRIAELEESWCGLANERGDLRQRIAELEEALKPSGTHWVAPWKMTDAMHRAYNRTYQSSAGAIWSALRNTHLAEQKGDK